MVRAGVLAAVIGLTACAAKPAQVYTGPPTPAPKSSIIEVKLERKGCFGTCPAYTLDLRDDDLATYTGLAYAPRRGTYVAILDFNSFARWLETQHLEALENGYALNAIDADRFVLTVRTTHGTKLIQVRNSREMPPELYGVTLAIDGLAARARWRRAAPVAFLSGEFVREDQASHFTTIMLAFGRDESLLGPYQDRRIAPCAPYGQTALDAELSAHPSGNAAAITANFYLSSGRSLGVQHWKASANRAGLTLRTARGTERYTRIALDDVRRALSAFGARAASASAAAKCSRTTH